MTKRYEEPNEVYAIIFGHLAKTFGKVQTSKFNKIAVELGYDTSNAKELSEFTETLDMNPHLAKLVDETITGSINLDELYQYQTEKKPFKEKTFFDVVTPYQVQHQRVLEANRNFNKVQREGAYLKALMEDLKEDLSTEFFSSSKYLAPIHSIKVEGSALIVTISDLHVGALIYDTGYGYNFEVLKERLSIYMQEIKNTLEVIDVETIRIYQIGDSVENVIMRNTQSFEAEFPLSEQIAKATRIMTEFITEVEQIKPVKFGIVNGNHDRLQANGKDKIYNDTVAYVILDTLFLLQDNGMFQNTELIDNRTDMDSFEDRVEGKNIYVTHGSYLKGNGKHITKLIKNHTIDFLFTGHVHNFKVQQEDFDRLHITVSSIMGANNYSKELNLAETMPSQTMVLLNKKLKGPIIYNVFFNKEREK